jgi:hypothetical protein
MNAQTVYQQLVKITQEYLGPAAERFIARLVDSHLHKTPDELSAKDIPQLTSWIKVSLGLLTNDKNLIDECEKRILRLAEVK